MTSLARWLAVALLMAWGGSALGSPFYHVTDLGDWADSLDSRNQLYELSQGWAAGPDHVLTNRTTGVSYAISKEPTHVRTSGELPGRWGTQGVSYPQRVYWTMRTNQSNAHGLVVGDLPNGTSRADPWGSTDTYYALLGEDGTYRVEGNLNYITPLAGSLHSSFTTDINAKNQILVYRSGLSRSFYSNPADWKPFDYHPPGGFLDIATGVVTELNQILPPGVRLATMGGLNLLDDGSVIGPADLGDGTLHMVMLTPPDQPPPQPVPEPSSLVVFAGLAAAVTWQRWRPGGRR